MIIAGKDIQRCYHQCPYFELDGGPGPVMVCMHPTLKDKGIEHHAIITHPECDTGFPAECPEVRIQGAAR